MQLKCCKREGEKGIKHTFIFRTLAGILWRINAVEHRCLSEGKDQLEGYAGKPDER